MSLWCIIRFMIIFILIEFAIYFINACKFNTNLVYRVLCLFGVLFKNVYEWFKCLNMTLLHSNELNLEWY